MKMRIESAFASLEGIVWLAGLLIACCSLPTAWMLLGSREAVMKNCSTIARLE